MLLIHKMKLLTNILFLCNNKVINNFIIIILTFWLSYRHDGEGVFMSFENIEEAYNNYLAIEPYLSNNDKLNYLKGFQELIKLYKLNMALEAVEENI